MIKGILLTTIGYSPNIGGIETHFDDLTSALNKRNWNVLVLTYKPITTAVNAPFFENRGKLLKIYRIPWPRGLFYLLVKNPIAEFIYLVPGLFIGLPIILIAKGSEISVIHSHGLVAGFTSVVWGKIFGKKVITTTHSIYNFPKSGLYRNFAKWIFKTSDSVLTLSEQSKAEIISLGVGSDKVQKFTYWVNLKKFKPGNVKNKDKFNILFVGRLIAEKGVRVLLKSLRKLNKNVSVTIIGLGPLEQEVKKAAQKFPNLFYLGKVKNIDLPKYYNASDMLVVPSIHEEGFGRVIIEALSCGLPVLGANRGAIPEAIDESVGVLIKVSPENIKKTIESFYKNPDKLLKLSNSARRFAQKNYSEKNVETITKAYSN